MIFSKKTLFAAATLAGTVLSVSAAQNASSFDENIPWTNNVQGNINIDTDLKIDIAKGSSYTLNGSFLSNQGAILDKFWKKETEGENVEWKLVYTSENTDKETITISGGGTLEYVGGVGSGYYTNTYLLTRGDKHTDSTDLILEAWKTSDNFLTGGNFTGTVVVDGAGTTLNLKGQLTQFVGLYRPEALDASSAASLEPSITGYYGASVTLKNGAVLSFEQSDLNLAEQRLSTNPEANRVNALNFVKNLKSDSASTLRIGSDEGSCNRIVVYSDIEDRVPVGIYTGAEISTVGRLQGNGRLYVIGGGAVAFIGQSELNPGNDTSGDTWATGNRLADVIIDNYVTFVGANVYGKTATGGDGSVVWEADEADENGVKARVNMLSDSEALAVAVDNVFANATAVHLGTTAQSTGDYQTVGTNQVLAGPLNASAITGPIQDRTLVTLYGDQLFNNFQSLWLERSELLEDATNSDASLTEAFLQSYRSGNSIVLQRGSGKILRVGGGSVLTINQNAHHDGWFQGELITQLDKNAQDYRLTNNGDGLVVKTGAGTFFYDQQTVSAGAILSRLRIEEGMWVSTLDGVEGTHVEIGDKGQIELVVEGKETVTGLFKGSGVLDLSRVAVLENDLTTESLADFRNLQKSGDMTGFKPEYRKYIVNYLDASAAGVQFATEQAQFTGTILVNDGLQLILGETGAKSPSIFSSAESIVLSGVNPEANRYTGSPDILGHRILENYDGTSLQRATLEILSGIQMVRNLVGEADYSAVNVEQGATLVLTQTSENAVYGGTISGNGNLVNLGGSRTVNSTGSDLFGALTSLSGSLSVNQTDANSGFSGLVLTNGSSASFSSNGYAKVGALVGAAETSVSASGDFTVGVVSDAALIGAEGEYFATAQYESYEKFFTGTSLKNNFYDVLADSAKNSRGGKFTRESTLEYLKNPAKLIYTTDENVYDGAFSRIFASTKYDATAKTDKVLETMQNNAGVKNSVRYDFSTGMSASDQLFSGEKTAAEWLRKVFSTKNIGAYLNSKDAQLSTAMKSSLRLLAEQIESGAEGVCAYLDGSNPNTASLNVAGWNKIVAAGGLEYLKAAYKSAGFDKMPDETLYSFITNFYPTNEKYQFQITDWNVEQIEKIYGVALVRPDYDDLKAAFGYNDTDFAGTLSGEVNLIKIGTESLKLTGVNSYSGKTQVRGGELYVDYDAISYTAGIEVQSGALLTINATKDMIKENHIDPDTGRIPTGYSEDTPGEMFESGSAARLSGAGVVLKVGDGVVDLGNALLDVPEGGSDFTGTFLVAEGGLIATIDAVKRNPQFGISLNAVSQYDNGQPIPASFQLVFARSEGSNAVIRSTEEGAIKLNFDGKIEGTGTFILDAGISGYIRGKEFESLGNNTLVVAAKNFSPTDTEVRSGTLSINADGTALTTKTFALGSDAQLAFDLKADTTLTNSVISGNANSGAEILHVFAMNLDLVNDQTGSTYEKKTLTLDRVQFASLDGIDLVGGAQLKITELNSASDDEKTIAISSLTMGAQTGLDLAFGRILKLSGDSVLGGALTGAGTLIFGGENLVFGNTDELGSEKGFSGKLTISSVSGKPVSVVFNAGKSADGTPKTVDFNGFSVEAIGGEDVTFVKAGEGIVKISENANVIPKNRINVGKLSVDVQAGTLEIGAGVLISQPQKLNIETGATFRYTDPFTNFTLEDLSTLSGAGTLAFATTETDATVTANKSISSAFTGVVDVGNNVTLKLGESVKEFAAFSGDGKIEVGSADGKLTISVNANESGAQKFDGEISGLKELVIVGDGALVFGTKPDGSSAAPTELTTVTVGSNTQSGGFGVDASWDKTVNAIGAESRILITNAGTSSFAGAVNVGENVSSLVLLRDGTLDLATPNAVSTAFGLKNADGSTALLLDGSMAAPKATIGNVAGAELTLKNLPKLSENVELQANADATGKGGLIFDTEQNAFTRSVVPTEKVTVWDKDISGTGGITVADGTVLQLNAGKLSFEGKTLIRDGATLIYGSEGAVSASSGLEVESHGTLIGGVRLVGENSDVVFNPDSTFVFTGKGIEFTGTAVAYGKFDVVLDESATNERGTPIALFKYVGNGNAIGKNGITFDELRITSADGLNYYKDASQTDPTIYVVAPDLANAGADLHEGTSSAFVETLNTITKTAAGDLPTVASNGIVLKEGRYSTLTAAGELAEAIIKTPNETLAGTLNNLSPLSYGAMLALPQSGFISDIAAISARIEQRRYDSYTQFAWEIHDDWEFFAEAQGTLAEADEGKPDTRTFDMNSYGAIAGADVKMNATTVAGFSVAYDFGDADIHANGGEIQSHDVRATAFLGKLFADRFYLDTGVQAGFAMFDVDRNTVLGGVNGDTTGWHAGAFANVGMLMPLFLSEDEKMSVNLMPYVGLAYAYYSVNAFDESGAATALDTDSFGASSLRATLGASLSMTFPWLEKTTRLNLDFAYTRELMDAEADIDYAMPGISDADYTASAKAFAEDTFSIGPRFSINLDRDNSIYAGYRFEVSTDSDTAHSVNIGFRSRF